IGDGLVSQIPSLCIAVAAGLVVTRVASEKEEDTLGSEIGSQFFGQSKALWVVSGLCLALGLMPGMPRLPFILIAAAAFGGGHAINKLKKKDAEAKTEEEQAAASAPAPEQHEPMAAGVAPLTIDLAPDLTAMVHEGGARFAKQELNVVRDQIFFELGVRVPGIRVRTGASYLAPGQYVIMLDEVPLARGQVKADALYAMGTPADVAFLQVKAEAGSHPATGKPMCKVTAESRAQLEAAQILVRTPAQLICEHLTFVLRRKASALLGVQEVQALIEQFEPQAPALVKEALNKVPLALLTDVLKKLVTEEVSVRNLRAIFDALVSPSTEGDANALAEKCRAALHRYLSHKYAPNGPLFAYLVDPAVEDTLRQRPADMDPDHVTAILDGVKRIAASGKAVLLAAPDVRRALRRLCEGAFPEVAVLTYGELDSSLQIRPLGKLAAAR
ncbi:MAG: FHIPEP family type III secretion protein, partial [Myxococcaceae bacterium]